MKYLYQFGVIAAVSLAGEVIHFLLPLPIPASIYGIILMFALLECGVIRADSIRETSTLLLEAMPFMFLPPAVAILDEWREMSANLAAYILIPILSTFLVMAVTGRVTQTLIEREKKSDEKSDAADAGRKDGVGTGVGTSTGNSMECSVRKEKV